MHTACLFAFVALQVQSVAMEDLLVALESGEPIREVSPALGREAVTLLAQDPALDASRAQTLIEVARLGRAESQLGRVLTRHVVEGLDTRPELAAVAVVAVAAFDEKQRARVQRRAPEDWGPALLRLAESDEAQVAQAATVLLAPRITPRLTGRLLSRFSEHDDGGARLRCLLAQADALRDPAELFPLLLELGSSGAAAERGVEEELGGALAALVARDEAAVAPLALLHAEGGSGGGAVIRALGAVTTPEHLMRAQAVVIDLLESELDEDGSLDELAASELTAALHTAGALLLDEAIPPARFWCTAPAPASVRRAAVSTFARLSYADAPTIDLLISLLGDPAVASAAHQALRSKSGADLALRPAAWTAWRHGRELPEAAPEEASVRLAREREMVFRSRQRMRGLTRGR